MKRNGTERRYDVNGLDRCLVSFVPVPFIGSSGGGIAQVVHRSAVEQVVTLTAGVTVYIGSGTARFITVETRMFPDCAGIAPTPSQWRHGCSRRLTGLLRYLTAFPVTPGESRLF